VSGRRRPCAFKQSDVTRALKAAKSAGYQSVRLEMDADGRIAAIVAGDGVGKSNEVASENPFDQWVQKHARETQGN
jgi:hypothetical protein